jgi:hypothetical protein
MEETENFMAVINGFDRGVATMACRWLDLTVVVVIR